MSVVLGNLVKICESTANIRSREQKRHTKQSSSIQTEPVSLLDGEHPLVETPECKCTTAQTTKMAVTSRISPKAGICIIDEPHNSKARKVCSPKSQKTTPKTKTITKTSIVDEPFDRQTLDQTDIAAYEKFDMRRQQIEQDIKYLLDENKDILGHHLDMSKVEQHFAGFFPHIPKKSLRKSPRNLERKYLQDAAARPTTMCEAYVQNGKRCSRRVKVSGQQFCGLHTFFRFGDIRIGYLRKNNFLCS
jgi:hypothetical protein